MIQEKPYYRFYHGCKKIVGYCLQLFYRRWQIEGYENLMIGEPMLMGSNHQNAFIDPLNIVCSTEKRLQPSFLTRSDVFNKNTQWLFERFKMLPIYRQRDGVDTLAKNKEIFDICVHRLSMDESVIIFVEGNHGMDYRIRPLQKGFARIGFQAAESLQFDKEIYIQPVGLNYTEHTAFRGDMLLIYGPPISLGAFYDLYQQDERKALVEVRNALSQALKKIVIHIPRTHYEIVNPIRLWGSDEALKRRKGKPNRLIDRFEAEKELIDQLETYLAQHPDEVAPIQEIVHTYQSQLEVLRVEDRVVARHPHRLGQLLIEALAVGAGFPVFVYGALNHLLVYAFAGRTANRLFKDKAFHSSIKFLVGLLGIPITYLVQTLLVLMFAGWEFALGYLVSLPFLGNAAFVYGRGVKHWWQRVRFWGTAQKKGSMAQAALNTRAMIREVISRVSTEVALVNPKG